MSKPCGTRAAYRRHRALNQQPCEPCTTANTAHSANERRKKGIPERTQTTTADLIEDIEFLLKAGEGECAILKATGYQGRTHSLRDRLSKAGRADLGTRIFNGWELAA
jgi:hypothetical protein